MKTSLVLSAILAAACVQVAQADTTERIKIDAGHQFFEANCQRCHSVDADRASYGPLLEKVVGRKAGSYGDYPYSDALKQANFVWTPGALRAWMEDNDAFIPGTKMRHVGIVDPTVQDFIVTYLNSQ
ncbi:c-type cytochrome [Thioclava sp. GXIMD4216]|uniref:c-type cytochrome n=1 Tax=unclassified Thioclava TaxID=2621713 RepID=UPI0030D4AC7F